MVADRLHLSALQDFRTRENQPAILAAIQRDIAGPGGGTHHYWYESVATLVMRRFHRRQRIVRCLPIRQFVQNRGGWRERMVVSDENGVLAFFAGMASPRPCASAVGAALFAGRHFELAPARNARCGQKKPRAFLHGRCHLFVDYGYLQLGVGDNFAGTEGHAFDDALANPGEADLTSHVDSPRFRMSRRHMV